MSADNNNIAKPNENQNETKTVDKSRRSFAKIGAAAPVIMTLTSKAALGSVYQCTISGAQSGNTSSHGSTQPNCGVGYSPGGWWQNACKTGNQDGNLNQWCKAGIPPFSIKSTTTGKGKSATTTNYIYYKGAWVIAGSASCTDQAGCSSWATIFTTIKNSGLTRAKTFSEIFGGPISATLWDVLDQNHGSLEWHAIADYLDALLFAAGGAPAFASVFAEVSAGDIVNLYKLAKGGPDFTSSSGTLITGNFNGGTAGSGVLAYLVSIHH